MMSWISVILHSLSQVTAFRYIADRLALGGAFFMYAELGCSPLQI